MELDKNEKLLKKAAVDIDKIVGIYTSSPRLMNRLGEDIVKQIRKRTRLGFGVSKSGEKIKFKELSKSYKAQRQGKVRFFTNKKTGKVFPLVKKGTVSAKDLDSFRASDVARRSNTNRRKYNKLVKKPTLAPTTRPSRSNLTATGLMLESLTRRVVGSRIFISLANATGKDMWGKFSRVTSNQKASFQAKMGRRFLDLAKFEQKIFRDRVTKEMLAISERTIRKL